jgi:mxaD protein
MTSIQVTERLPYSAEAVWAVIGDFGGLHRWHPQVRRLDLSWEGRIRTLHYVNGARVVERLEARNDSARRYMYVLVDGSLPLHACRSRLEALADGTHCRVTWYSDFDALGDGEQAAKSTLQQIYRCGLAALATAVGAGNH